MSSPITDEQISALDPDAMTPEQRIAFINDARVRRAVGETLTDSHLKFAVRCMRSERKVSAAAAGAKRKAPVIPTSLDLF